MSLLNLFKEELPVLYGLSERDYATYRLIHRYREKVSPRLLEEQKRLKAKGKNDFRVLLKEMIYAPNPLLGLIPKDHSFVGRMLPVPITYKEKMNATDHP